MGHHRRAQDQHAALHQAAHPAAEGQVQAGLRGPQGERLFVFDKGPSEIWQPCPTDLDPVIPFFGKVMI